MRTALFADHCSYIEIPGVSQLPKQRDHPCAAAQAQPSTNQSTANHIPRQIQIQNPDRYAQAAQHSRVLGQAQQAQAKAAKRKPKRSQAQAQAADKAQAQTSTSPSTTTHKPERNQAQAQGSEAHAKAQPSYTPMEARLWILLQKK